MARTEETPDVFAKDEHDQDHQGITIERRQLVAKVVADTGTDYTLLEAAMLAVGTAIGDAGEPDSMEFEYDGMRFRITSEPVFQAGTELSEFSTDALHDEVQRRRGGKP